MSHDDDAGLDCLKLFAAAVLQRLLDLSAMRYL